MNVKLEHQLTIHYPDGVTEVVTFMINGWRIDGSKYEVDERMFEGLPLCIPRVTGPGRITIDGEVTNIERIAPHLDLELRHANCRSELKKITKRAKK